MKTLFLIRHAKSSWDDTALPDKDRPLSDRGRRDAPKMGKRLAKRDVKPDLILSSPARRALTTAEIIAKKLDYKRKNIVVADRLYSGAVHDLLNVVQKLGDKLQRVMLFGHNPELTELAHRLSSEAPCRHRAQRLHRGRYRAGQRLELMSHHVLNGTAARSDHYRTRREGDGRNI
jgi:phosphohistidine phosphatase